MGIIAGTTNYLWVVANFTNKIFRLLLSGDVLSEYTILTDGSNAQLLAVSPDGRIWFTEMDGNQIGELTPRGGSQYLPVVIK